MTAGTNAKWGLCSQSLDLHSSSDLEGEKQGNMWAAVTALSPYVFLPL